MKLTADLMGSDGLVLAMPFALFSAAPVTPDWVVNAGNINDLRLSFATPLVTQNEGELFDAAPLVVGDKARVGQSFGDGQTQIFDPAHDAVFGCASVA